MITHRSHHHGGCAKQPVATILSLVKILVCLVLVLPFVSITEALSLSSVRHAVHHLKASPPKDTVESLANERIPRRDGGAILAYCARPSKKISNKTPVVILIHEFFGLSQSICDKARGLADDLDCIVVAPDTFRGQSSTFIPKCIWLALTTPQDRVNQDLDDVVAWTASLPNVDTEKLAVMGFCYGGGKAIRYTTERQPIASTVVCYGSPVTDVEALSKLTKPVCGVFGARDVQFPPPVLDSFRNALAEANVEADICVYEGVGHAFWSDMEQVRRGDEPQAQAYKQITSFLKKQFQS